MLNIPFSLKTHVIYYYLQEFKMPKTGGEKNIYTFIFQPCIKWLQNGQVFLWQDAIDQGLESLQINKSNHYILINRYFKCAEDILNHVSCLCT